MILILLMADGWLGCATTFVANNTDGWLGCAKMFVATPRALMVGAKSQNCQTFLLQVLW